MQITLVFDSWEELEKFRGEKKLIINDSQTVSIMGVTKDPVSESMPEDPLPEPVSEQEPVADPEPIDMKAFREKVKDALYQWNVANPGERPAQKKIKAMGYEKFTDVPDDRLQELMDAVEVK